MQLNRDKMRPFEELDPELQKDVTQVNGLREQNAILAGKIEQLGGGVDTANARIEHLLVSLVTSGRITEHEMWAINLDWELTLRPQLKDSLQKMQAIHQERVEAQRQAHIAAQREAAKPKLIIPGRG